MDASDRRLDPEFRRMVLADAEMYGPSAAAERHAVSRMTVSRWRNKKGSSDAATRDSLQPGRPGRPRMDSSDACRRTRRLAVEEPWLTVADLQQRIAEDLGHPLSVSAVRKYLSAIGSKPEDRAFCFDYRDKETDDQRRVLPVTIGERGRRVEWPEKARQRPGGALLHLSLRVSVPRRPSLFVELVADWLTGRVWLATHLQEPEPSVIGGPLRKAMDDLGKAGFQADCVVPVWIRYANDPYAGVYRREGLRTLYGNEWYKSKWNNCSDSRQYIILPLKNPSVTFPVDLTSINDRYLERAKNWSENSTFWSTSHDRAVETQINAAPLWMNSASQPSVSPLRFWSDCAAYLNERWTASHRKGS